MKTILIGIFALITAIGIIMLVWYYYLRWRFRKIVAVKYHIIAPLIKKLELHENILKQLRQLITNHFGKKQKLVVLIDNLDS